MSTKHGFDIAALARASSASTTPPAEPVLPPEPVGAMACSDLSAHIELSETQAERFADAMLDESGPTPAMLALFDRYGRR